MLTGGAASRWTVLDNFESSYDSADASLTISPSLSSLVTQVKKGYDDVILSSNFSSRLRDGVHSLVNEVRSLNRAYNKGATENGHLPGRDDNDELLFQVFWLVEIHLWWNSFSYYCFPGRFFVFSYTQQKLVITALNWWNYYGSKHCIRFGIKENASHSIGKTLCLLFSFVHIDRKEGI